MADRRKILITGAAGRIGSCLAQGLQATEAYNIIAADLNANEEQGIKKLDVTNAEQLLALTEGVDTVLHIAWAKDEEDFLGKVLPINVTGAYHLYEAARKQGVRRIIFASSNHATGFYKVDEEVEVTDPYRPDSFYGLSKCYIELLDCMRIGMGYPPLIFGLAIFQVMTVRIQKERPTFGFQSGIWYSWLRNASRPRMSISFYACTEPRPIQIITTISDIWNR